MATVLLLGLDDLSADTIAKLSLQAGHVPRREAMRTTFLTRPEETLIFVSGDQSSYRDALRSLRHFGAYPPVVVVSRLGEPSRWVEAMEAGAADFISAPFTLDQISGSIQAALPRPKTFAASGLTGSPLNAPD